ncbi:DUF6544 family protein [Bacteroidota bacterium]
MSIFSFLKTFKSVKRIYQREIREQFSKMEVSQDIITEEDISHLPDPVQRYFRYTGWIGKEKVYNAMIRWEGLIKMKPDKKFIKLKSSQYNFTSPPARIVHLKNIIIGGRDKYIDGRGNMLIKLLSRFTVANESGEHMDRSALITYLNDICLLVPGALFDDRISWKAMDTKSAEVIIRDSGYTVSAVLHFNDDGALINFVTHDRYMDNMYEPVKWSTPVSDYKDFNGINIPGKGAAIWHLEEGDFLYVKFNLMDIKYNLKNWD